MPKAVVQQNQPKGKKCEKTEVIVNFYKVKNEGERSSFSFVGGVKSRSEQRCIVSKSFF